MQCTKEANYFFFQDQLFLLLLLICIWFPCMLVLGLTLDKSSNDFVDGKVVGVSSDLYMKGCVQDVSEGIKVRYCTGKVFNP